MGCVGLVYFGLVHLELLLHCTAGRETQHLMALVFFCVSFALLFVFDFGFDLVFEGFCGFAFVGYSSVLGLRLRAFGVFRLR